MRLKLNKYLLLCCLFLVALMPMPASAEDGQYAGISDSSWSQLTEQKAFYYKNEREYRPGQETEDKDPRDMSESWWAKMIRFFEGDGKVLIYLGLLVAAGFILYYVVLSKNMSSVFGRKTKPAASSDPTVENIEDIAETNWERLMQEAAQQGNYRNAIRYSYLQLLQLLQAQQLIKYRIDKTNYEYYHELSDSQYKVPFKQLSRQYEYAWYGRLAIDEPAYHQYLQEFNQLKRQLGQ
ncbi:MAG: DUF4129 domain-containing protein [Bacteroidetes bacterium]|nr:DUF4129 domain-containing protein [Bacteroidota bacterium]